MKNKSLRKAFFSFGIVAMPISLVISCSPTRAKTTDEQESLGEKIFWNDKLKKDVTNTPIEFEWDADKSNSIADIIDQMDSLIKFKLPKKMETMTPVDFGNYLVHFYNATNGGLMNFSMTYKDKTDLVKFDFRELLSNLIDTLDMPGEAIREKTPQASFTTVEEATEGLLKKITLGEKNLSGLAPLLSLLGDYVRDIFNIESILSLSSPTANNPRNLGILNLLSALPSTTIKNFSNLVNSVEEMSSQFKGSALAQKWAKDHKLTKEFNNLNHAMVRILVNSGI